MGTLAAVAVLGVRECRGAGAHVAVGPAQSEELAAPGAGLEGVARAERAYQPRDTEHTVLHAVVGGHLAFFLDATADRGAGHGLPGFIEREFRDFLAGGVLAHGFARLRCEGCALERPVPFSCKGARGIGFLLAFHDAPRLLRRPGGEDVAVFGAVVQEALRGVGDRGRHVLQRGVGGGQHFGGAGVAGAREQPADALVEGFEVDTLVDT